MRLGKAKRIRVGISLYTHPLYHSYRHRILIFHTINREAIKWAMTRCDSLPDEKASSCGKVGSIEPI